MSKFSAIFDLNGVIVNDIPFHKMAWAEVAKQHGIEISDERFEREFNGRTNPYILRMLLGNHLTEPEIQRYGEIKEELYRKLFAEHRELLPGLRDLLEELKAHQIPIGISSGAPPKNVSFILDKTGIRDYFQAIVDESKVENGKPNPAIYLVTAKELKISPEQCVVFEDGLLGISAARGAGMKVIGVTTTHPEDEFPPLEGVINDFREIDYEGLKALFDE